MEYFLINISQKQWQVDAKKRPCRKWSKDSCSCVNSLMLKKPNICIKTPTLFFLIILLFRCIHSQKNIREYYKFVFALL